MRVVERRICADAHEFMRTDRNHSVSGVVVEMWNGMSSHRSPLIIVTWRFAQYARQCKPLQ